MKTVMDISINKILLFAIFFCIIACNSNEEVSSKLLCITDSKPCTDSLYETQRSSYNARYIKFVYVVKNNTQRKLYLPIRTDLFNDTINSTISACLVNKDDTIKPIYKISKIPYNKDVINEGDSMLIYVEFYHFYKWQRKWCNVNTGAKDILNMLRLKYIKSDKDVNNSVKRADIIFESTPQKYLHYEVKRGSSIDVL